MTIIWCMVPETWSTTDRIFCHPGLFFALLPLYGPKKIKTLKKWKNTGKYYHFKKVYHKWQSYDIWFLRYGMQLTTFFVILGCFSPFYPPNNPKNQNFTQVYHKWKLYDVWFLRYRARCTEFLSFLTIFCRFTPGFELVKQNWFAKKSHCRWKIFWICKLFYEKWEDF